VKTKIVRLIVPLLLMFCVICFTASDKVFAVDQDFIDKYTAPKHVVYEGWAYGYEFDVDIDFSSDGTATAKISGLRTQHSQAYTSLNLTAEVTHIAKGNDMVKAMVEIKATGKTRSVHMPLATAKDPSTWTWGEVSEEPSTDDFREMLFFPYDKYPELEKIESFEQGSATEVYVEETQDQEPEPTKPESLEEVEVRTYLKSKEGMVRIKKADGRWVKAEEGMELEVGDMVKTLSNGKVEVVLKGTARIKIKPGSEFYIPRDKANTKEKVGFIKMVKGFLWAKAKKDKNSLKIATPNAICGVRGTEFEVTFKDGITCVNVIEGTVWLAEAEGLKEHIITVGQTACIPKGGQQVITPQPQPGTDHVSGTWNTSFGMMTLTQNGSNVTGSYTNDSGKIEGTLEGNILLGSWSERPSYKPPHDAGDIEFTFSEDGRSFTGTWRYGFDKQTWNGKWRGTKE
jgi:hypothetical protein